MTLDVLRWFGEFANVHPWLAGFVAFLVFRLLIVPFTIVKLGIRHFNIRNAGWPPVHIDADGDSRKEA